MGWRKFVKGFEEHRVRFSYEDMVDALRFYGSIRAKYAELKTRGDDIDRLGADHMVNITLGNVRSYEVKVGPKVRARVDEGLLPEDKMENIKAWLTEIQGRILRRDS